MRLNSFAMICDGLVPLQGQWVEVKVKELVVNSKMGLSFPVHRSPLFLAVVMVHFAMMSVG